MLTRIATSPALGVRTSSIFPRTILVHDSSGPPLFDLYLVDVTVLHEDRGRAKGFNAEAVPVAIISPGSSMVLAEM